MREAYKAYFSMPVGYQDKSWAPHFTGISHLQETAASPDSEEDIGDPGASAKMWLVYLRL